MSGRRSIESVRSRGGGQISASEGRIGGEMVAALEAAHL